MIIIADSGSTKTDWCVVNHGKQVKRITTEGTNPFISMGQVVPFQKRMRLSTMPFIGTYR